MNMKTTKTKTNQGFSLVEMLVVVAIMGILAAAAVPQYQRYIAKSKGSQIIQLATEIKKEVALCIQLNFGTDECDQGKNGIRPNNFNPEITIHSGGTLSSPFRSHSVQNGVILIHSDYEDSSNSRAFLRATPKLEKNTVTWKHNGNLCNASDSRGNDCSKL